MPRRPPTTYRTPRIRDEALLDRAVELFEPLAGQPLTREDAQEITSNIASFFQILARWKQRELAQAAGGER